MKKLVSLFLIALLCAGFMLPVFAEMEDTHAQAETTHVFDTILTLSDSELEELDEYAVALSAEYGIDLAVLLLADTDGENTYEYARTFYQEGMASGMYSNSGLVFVYNKGDKKWAAYRAGRVANLFSEDDVDAAWDVFAAEADDAIATRDYLDFVANLLDEKGTQPLPDGRQYERLVDDAELLTTEEEAVLLEKLNEISERQQCDVVIVTVKTLGGKSAQDFADDFFDYNGFGYGPAADGALFLICPEERDWWFSTHAFGLKAFTDAGQDSMMKTVKPHLSADRYNKAFLELADQCDRFLTQARAGDPYDVGSLPARPRGLQRPLTNVIISLVVGVVVAFLVVTAMKAPLKSVRRQAAAGSYLRQNSLNLTNSRESFLYRNVSRTARPTESSGGGGGGSSSHSSSSGRSHGGSGGKY